MEGGAVQEKRSSSTSCGLEPCACPGGGCTNLPVQASGCLPACLPAWPVHILPLSQPLTATWAACPGSQPAASSITGAGESLGWKSWPTLPSLGRAPSSFRC